MALGVLVALRRAPRRHLRRRGPRSTSASSPRCRLCSPTGTAPCGRGISHSPRPGRSSCCTQGASVDAGWLPRPKRSAHPARPLGHVRRAPASSARCSAPRSCSVRSCSMPGASTRISLTTSTPATLAQRCSASRQVDAHRRRSTRGTRLNVPLPPEPRLFRAWFSLICTPGQTLVIEGIRTRLTDPPSWTEHACPTRNAPATAASDAGTTTGNGASRAPGSPVQFVRVPSVP